MKPVLSVMEEAAPSWFGGEFLLPRQGHSKAAPQVVQSHNAVVHSGRACFGPFMLQPASQLIKTMWRISSWSPTLKTEQLGV